MSTKQREALKQANAVLRGLTFRDTQIDNALRAIFLALDELDNPPPAKCLCRFGECESKPNGCRMFEEVRARDPQVM